MVIFYTILILISVILSLIHHNNLQEDARIGLPGPKGFPFIGSIIELLPYKKTKKFLKKFQKDHDTYGDTYQLRIGHMKCIISRDAKIAEAVLNISNIEKTRYKRLVEPWIGDCLLFSVGEKWYKMRNLIKTAFHFKILESFITIYEKNTETFIGIIEQEMKNSDAVDVSDKLHALSLDNIAENSMGVQLMTQSDPHCAFMVAHDKIFRMFFRRASNGLLAVDWIFRLTKYYKIWTENLTIINDWFAKIIMERRKKLLMEKKNQVKTEKCYALLDILLQGSIDGRPLTNEQISDEVKLFIFAGYETTAKALGFTAYLLAKHPEVQEKLYHEIKSSIKSGDPLTSRDLNSLSYLDKVCKESLRLFPPAYMTFRESVEDFCIGNLLIPKNTTIITNIFGIHRNEKYFKDPEVFNPDRFDEELPNSYVFQPFSAGLRNCIGQKYAMLQIKTVFVKLILKFQWELADKNFQEDLIQNSFTLRFRNGIPLKFKKRL